MAEDRSCQVQAHPSLALVKYWGKQTTGINLPATTSIAVTLSDLTTNTMTVAVDIAEGDSVSIDGTMQPPERFAQLFDVLRAWITAHGGARHAYRVVSSNNFPTAAGLASSASGFAALVSSAVSTSLPDLDTQNPEIARELSVLARIGSGSAARSIYGGFTRWRAGAEYAEPLYPPDWWPELRIVVLPVAGGSKPISSRLAMNRTGEESPFFDPWVRDAATLAVEAEEAIADRDLQRLGRAMRLSYMRMFATMLGASPPILYWLPETVAIIRKLEELRNNGISVWETIDAGPQVKVVCTVEDTPALLKAVRGLTVSQPVVCSPGAAAQ